MKKYAAIAAAAAAIALGGCATATAVPPPQTAPVASNIYEAVWQGWDGSDRPDERWIDTSATLVCKQIIGGYEPRVVMDHAGNNEVVVAAAEQFVCEHDR